MTIEALGAREPGPRQSPALRHDAAMEDAAETMGSIAAGGILAREVERAHAPGHDHSDDCANCGAHLAGPYCQMCGQHGHVHRTVMALVHDIGHGVFHFEGKVWGTLPMLFAKPGELTRRYAKGERAKFVSPMALFLFSVFLLFAVTSSLTKHWNFGPLEGSGAMKREMAEEQVRLRARVATLQRQAASAARPESGRNAAEKEKIAADLAEANEDLANLNRAAAAVGVVGRDDGMPVDTRSSYLDAKLKVLKENPDLAFYKVKSAAYKYSWALIPISLPFIWLLFPLRRDVGMYDHAIFATYSLAFVTLFAIGLTLVYFAGAGGDWLWVVFIGGVTVHMYRQLKGAYGLGRWGAAARTATLLVMTSVTTTLFFLMLLYLGLAG
ncbi:DUF3667 domain-containing protein [Sphingomonas sp. ID0503]|uniref:DUF3667 domain-containing protein n=1 Tax=Sphingomonas sp. ID0503 TaxID=3399691 RepID=UPI003AFA9FCB